MYRIFSAEARMSLRVTVCWSGVDCLLPEESCMGELSAVEPAMKLGRGGSVLERAESVVPTLFWGEWRGMVSFSRRKADRRCSGVVLSFSLEGPASVTLSRMVEDLLLPAFSSSGVPNKLVRRSSRT